MRKETDMTLSRWPTTAAAAALAIMISAGPTAAGPLDLPGYAKAFTCSACHGFGGQSTSDAMPILAGMPPPYFKKAIGDYASGQRPSPEMSAYSKMVVQLGVDDVAAYFAGQPFKPTAIKVDPVAAGRGRAASASCVVCHGPDGRGDIGKMIPSLAGQPPGYLRNQMLLFKRDQRSPGDEALKAPKALMRTIPDEQIADLAAYYSSIR
jgi:cytochrome c553